MKADYLPIHSMLFFVSQFLLSLRIHAPVSDRLFSCKQSFVYYLENKFSTAFG